MPKEIALQLGRQDCIDIVKAHEALRSGKKLPPRAMERLGELSGRCSEAMED